MKKREKRFHKMWYIFPQLKVLGRNLTAKFYGIENIDEAKMYQSHPVLGSRLGEISEALLTFEESNPYMVMGDIDRLPPCCSMTLFAEIARYDSIFGQVINKYYNGKRDDNTIALLYRTQKGME